MDSFRSFFVLLRSKLHPIIGIYISKLWHYTINTYLIENKFWKFHNTPYLFPKMCEKNYTYVLSTSSQIPYFAGNRLVHVGVPARLTACDGVEIKFPPSNVHSLFPPFPTRPVTHRDVPAFLPFRLNPPASLLGPMLFSLQRLSNNKKKHTNT